MEVKSMNSFEDREKSFDKKSMILIALEDTGSIGVLTNLQDFSQKKK